MSRPAATSSLTAAARSHPSNPSNPRRTSAPHLLRTQLRTRRSLFVAVTATCVVGIGAVALAPAIRRELRSRFSSASVQQRVAEVSGRVLPVWESRLQAVGLPAIPERLILVADKTARACLVLAPAGADGSWVQLARYSFTAASGTTGPKLREGDHQVPEGFYGVESLNPNSRFHLALRVGYPSPADLDAAAADARPRDTLGGDIMIHGGASSVGCIALGDSAIEELFWLVATVGKEHVELLITPGCQPTKLVSATTPGWLARRYGQLEARFVELGISSPAAGPP